MAEEIEWWDFDAAEDLIDAVVGDVSFIIESALGCPWSGTGSIPRRLNA